MASPFLYLCAQNNNLDMKIEDKLVTSVISGLKALYGQDVPAAHVQLQKTKKSLKDTSPLWYSPS